MRATCEAGQLLPAAAAAAAAARLQAVGLVRRGRDAAAARLGPGPRAAARSMSTGDEEARLHTLETLINSAASKAPGVVGAIWNLAK